MTRAKDISKILTDANISGTLDVSGAFTSQGIDDNADATAITIDSSEQVGIGTTSPNSRLTSASTDGSTGLSIHRTFSGNVSGETTTGGLDFTLTDTATSNQVVSRISPVGSAGTGDAFAGAMRFYTAGTNGSIAERMRIPISDSRSVLAIGTTTVYTGILSTTATSSSLISMNSGQGSEIVLGHHDALSTSGLGAISFNRGTANLAAIDGLCDGATNSGAIRFNTVSSGGSITERMRINSSGNVGIGLTNINSSDKLSISGGRARITNSVAQSGNSMDNSSFSGLIINNSNDANGDLAGVVMYPTSSYQAAAAVFGIRESTNAASLSFWTGSETGSERMRIDSSGNVLIGTTGSMDLGFGSQQLSVRTTGGTSPAIFGNTHDTTTTLIAYASGSNYTGIVQDIRIGRAVSNAYGALIVKANASSSVDTIFYLRGDGNAFADNNWNAGGADYAEYFEWKDGNTDDEDRRGYTVVLDGHQIRKSTSDDNPSTIIGAISGNPSVVGDNAWNSWSSKYQKDDYGSYVLNSDGDRVLNSSYDDTKEYVNREDRQEWDIVGLMGKLRIRVGQTVGSNWIKMREISDTVHEYLVR